MVVVYNLKKHKLFHINFFQHNSSFRLIFVLLNTNNKGTLKSSQVDTCLVSSIYTRGISYRGRERGILTCYPDTALVTAKELMEAKGIKQLPVVKRGKERKRRIVAVVRYDSIFSSLRFLTNLKLWCFINKISFTFTIVGISWIYDHKKFRPPEIPGCFILRKNVTNNFFFQFF